MTLQDQTTLVLTIWRENRGGGQPGMQSVCNVILNRAKRDNSDVSDECLKRLQFSSMTASGDPELRLGPDPLDPVDWAAWGIAVNLVNQAAQGNLPDITGGATDYYAPAGIRTTVTYTLPSGQVVPFPEGWNPAVVSFTVEISKQLFFTEEA